MSDLILSRYRDPWTRWTEIHIQKAEWVSRYFQKMGRQIHERGFHYWLVSLGDVIKPDGTPYLNTEKDWSHLQDWVRWAKYLQVGDWSNLIDRKHPQAMDYLETNVLPAGYLYQPEQRPSALVDSELKQLVNSLIQKILDACPYYETAGYQNYFLVVFCEKNSMNDYIAPVMERFNGVFQPLVGESSLEKVEGIIRRAAEFQKPVRIFYISDFDPSGEHMPVSVARKMEWFAREKFKFPFDIKLKPIALNYEQVTKFQLPGIPTKESDSRAKAFIERFGDRATELDALEALHPGELAEIVKEALEPYYDHESPRILRDENYRISKKAEQMLQEIRPKLEEALSGLQVEGLEYLDLQNALDENFLAPKPSHKVPDDNGHWLLDTSLEYDKQIEIYRHWKDGSANSG